MSVMQYVKIHFLLHRKFTVSIAKISQLRMFQEIITVHSENHMKPEEYSMFTKC
jgi:hypothetical protein